uniref:NADH dehydrogenase subunit 4L n=1 Tax=Haslea pseudostrearia TaxID=197756 RepID=UPI0021F97B8F|nr:NADH dehydrogenase subunit 4L [Haslea pseudostrearia]UXN44203.1 NADH dehydrogenase subunit 4L [Haslea pseudostrearia]
MSNLKIGLTELLQVSTGIFSIGTFGLVLNRKNILLAIMSLELLLLAVNFNFMLFSIYLDDLYGSVFIILVLTIAASESALGLAILTLYYKEKHSIELKAIKTNKFKV